MRLDGPDSKNIDDRRGQRGGGGGMGRVAVGGGFGAILLVLLSMFLGVDVTNLGGGQMAPPSASEQRQAPPSQANLSEDEARRFISRVLAETEQVWNEAFQSLGRRYEEPVLVLYSGATRSGCGAAQAQVGPFYCPADKRVYIDLDFMGRLLRQLGAPGDFAAAYIVAHEVGHHVQHELGVLEKVEGLKRRVDQRTANELQVRVELQADCLAGLWAKRAHDARRILEAGDIEEGFRAAAAVGDDTLQRKSQGYVQPETFTHGSSEQR
ncbi:MAG: neutral zinc metallopeptidase, partial [bacterium]